MIASAIRINLQVLSVTAHRLGRGEPLTADTPAISFERLQTIRRLTNDAFPAATVSGYRDHIPVVILENIAAAFVTSPLGGFADVMGTCGLLMTLER
jgi:hypothetical protein